MVLCWSGFYLQSKLKEMKGKIKGWQKNRGVWGSEKIKSLEVQLHEIVSKMDIEGASEVLRIERLQLLNNLWKEYRKEESMWVQKARVRWLNFGDNNSQYFHKVSKVKESRCSLRNLSFNGESLTARIAIKQAVFNHFQSFFKGGRIVIPKLK